MRWLTIGVSKDNITLKGEHTCNRTLNFQYLNSETTLAPPTTFVDTFVLEKTAILSLYSHQIYESLLIELRIQYASFIYIIPTKSKIYNMIRENSGSMFVNNIHQTTKPPMRTTSNEKPIFRRY
ncbi:hypothetical protein HZS_860 [Henneguya salminicola]|nr:hypothetical protein HZS_860 [Henneguya salminicola]